MMSSASPTLKSSKYKMQVQTAAELAVGIGAEYQYDDGSDTHTDSHRKKDHDAPTVSCKCLNVSFKLSCVRVSDHDDGGEIQREKASLSDYATVNSLLVQPKKLSHESIALSDFGGQIIFPYLVIVKEIQGWSVSTCFNCKITTHVVSLRNGKHAFVNYGEMLHRSQQETEISNNPNYCKLFGIVTYPVVGHVEKPSTLKPSVMDVLRDIKESSAEYVEDEKANMRKRIHEYEATQQAKFEDLRSTVSTNKMNLEKQIWAAFNEANDDVDSAFESSVEEISSSISQNIIPTSGKSGRSSSLADEMFELDPFAEDNFNDDDDEIFTDDESVTPNYQSRQSGRAEMPDMLAKSVPIPIMGHFRASTSRASGSFSDEDVTPQPQDMQASMRALAQSVGGDGTEMFGDLPRNRFSSYSRRSQHGRDY